MHERKNADWPSGFPCAEAYVYWLKYPCLSESNMLWDDCETKTKTYEDGHVSHGHFHLLSSFQLQEFEQ